MISLGTDDNTNTNDTIINYSEFSDHPIPHILQVRVIMYKKKRDFINVILGYQLGLWIGLCGHDTERTWVWSEFRRHVSTMSSE